MWLQRFRHFVLSVRMGALCWRNCEGPGQGGASDFRLYVASVLLPDRNVNTAAMHWWGKTVSVIVNGIRWFIMCAGIVSTVFLLSCRVSQVADRTVSRHCVVYIWVSPSCLFHVAAVVVILLCIHVVMLLLSTEAVVWTVTAQGWSCLYSCQRGVLFILQVYTANLERLPVVL